CELFNKNTNAPLVADTHSPVTDAPVPAGFTMRKESTSKVVPGNSLRFVDHSYSGEDAVLPVVNFYKEQMPEKGWTLLDQTQPSGREVVLHFSKAKED